MWQWLSVKTIIVTSAFDLHLSAPHHNQQQCNHHFHHHHWHQHHNQHACHHIHNEWFMNHNHCSHHHHNFNCYYHYGHYFHYYHSHHYCHSRNGLSTMEGYINDLWIELNTIQYTLISAFFREYAKLRSARTCLGSTDALVLQSIVCEELVQCPYTLTVYNEAQTSTLHVSALTNWPPCQRCATLCTIFHIVIIVAIVNNVSIMWWQSFLTFPILGSSVEQLSMKTWATTDRQDETTSDLQTSNTKLGFVMTFTQNLSNKL